MSRDVDRKLGSHIMQSLADTQEQITYNLKNLTIVFCIRYVKRFFNLSNSRVLCRFPVHFLISVRDLFDWWLHCHRACICRYSLYHRRVDYAF